MHFSENEPLIILEWSKSAAWFRESPCRDYKSLRYWFGVKESFVKSNYHVKSMALYTKAVSWRHTESLRDGRAKSSKCASSAAELAHVLDSAAITLMDA
ncbi:hypothetical protein HDV02_006677 [Globomyces sp. JEL0801]|nr:hypothetical protein HDV02_006677 [Globomyces sp. JEL0801]